MRLAAAVSLLAACTIELPPPQVPEQIVPRPDVVLGPPAPGEGDVVIDTVGGAADVVDVAGFGSSEISRTVCSTPCEVHLSQGLHDLHFVDQVTHEWRGDGRITVGAVPSAYRYALGHEDYSGPGLAIGAIVFVTAASGAITGALVGSPEILGVSAALAVLSGLGLYLLRPQIQRGVGVQWTPPRAAAGTER